MDLTEIESDFQRWVFDVLDVPHAALNGNSPCPFAKQAWVKKRYTIDLVTDLRRDLQLSPMTWPNECDLRIYVFHPEQIVDPNWLTTTTKMLNQHHLLPAGYIALEGHPDIAEAVLDCDMNQGRHAYVIVQPLDKLAKHKAVLEKRGYYDNWSADMLATIVSSRES